MPAKTKEVTAMKSHLKKKPQTIQIPFFAPSRDYEGLLSTLKTSPSISELNHAPYSDVNFGEPITRYVVSFTWMTQASENKPMIQAQCEILMPFRGGDSLLLIQYSQATPNELKEKTTDDIKNLINQGMSIIS